MGSEDPDKKKSSQESFGLPHKKSSILSSESSYMGYTPSAPLKGDPN